MRRLCTFASLKFILFTSSCTARLASVFESILNTKSNQLSLSQELSKRLEADLKKQKMKTKLMGGAGIVIAIGVAVLVN